ncbi:MAG: hypothetical protein AB7F74_05065 [Parvibaculaceae bacterium]
MTTLEKERQEAEERLKASDDAERQRRVDDEVAAERSRKALAAAAEAERLRQAEIRADIGEAAAKYLKALDEAEAGAIAMAASLRSVFATAAQINTLMKALPAPMRISSNEVADRLSRKLSALLAGIEHQGQFGHVILFSGLLIDPGMSWPDSELKQTNWLTTFHALKEKTDGKDR